MHKINIRPKILISSIVIALAAFLILAAVLVYGFSVENPWLRLSVKNIPYPAAIIKYYHPVAFSELQNNLDAVQKFYENQDLSNSGLRVDFSTDDGKKRLKIKEKYLLNKLIENKIIEILAKEKGIVITDAMVNREIEKIKDQTEVFEKESEDKLKKLSQLYGWNVAELEEKVIKPDVLKEKLAATIKEKDGIFLAAQNKIAEAQAELKQKKKFEDVAAKYSEGESAKNGGELGWFTIDQMVPEVALASLSLEKGETSAIVESSLGFHIIQLIDKKTEDNLEKLHLKQIFVKTPNFSEWFFNQEKTFPVQILLKDFYWDKENQMVEFREQALRDFEEYLKNNFPGDISVLF